MQNCQMCHNNLGKKVNPSTCVKASKISQLVSSSNFLGLYSGILSSYSWVVSRSGVSLNYGIILIDWPLRKKFQHSQSKKKQMHVYTHFGVV